MINNISITLKLVNTYITVGNIQGLLIKWRLKMLADLSYVTLCVRATRYFSMVGATLRSYCLHIFFKLKLLNLFKKNALCNFVVYSAGLWPRDYKIIFISNTPKKNHGWNSSPCDVYNNKAQTKLGSTSPELIACEYICSPPPLPPEQSGCAPFKPSYSTLTIEVTHKWVF